MCFDEIITSGCDNANLSVVGEKWFSLGYKAASFCFSEHKSHCSAFFVEYSFICCLFIVAVC